MLEVHERLGNQVSVAERRTVLLTQEQRDRGRLRTLLSDGEELRIFLPRGTPLKVGEYLRSRCGQHILVEGAKEDVVTATAPDWKTFSLACYHLGNRHVKVQIGPRWLRILPDHVLEDMLRGLGLKLDRGRYVFVPVSGAYGHHGDGGHHHHLNHHHPNHHPGRSP